MKLDICKTKNPLVRDASAQNQRELKELQPRYARIDDRLLSDLLLFARGYAQQVQYYNQQHKADGDWRAFFEKDQASLLAEISNKNIDTYRQLSQFLQRKVDEFSSVQHIEESGLFRLLFDFLFHLAIDINRWAQRSKGQSQLSQHLRELILSEFRQILSEAVLAYNYASDEGLLDGELTLVGEFRPSLEAVRTDILSAYWQDDSSITCLEDWLGSGQKDHQIFDYTNSTELLGRQSAAKAILAWVDNFLQGISQLVKASPGYLFQVIHYLDDHSPHMALYLAFLRLFKYAQIQLNKLTASHLDFYYQQILKFELKPAVSDQVHLLFELAKPVEQHLLKADTQFKAGFDSDGLPLLYQLNDETALNKASIAEPGDIKSVFIKRIDGRTQAIYKTPVANSADGQGKEFESEETTKWSAFTQTEQVEMGFAIASPLLDLREGAREIFVTFDLSQVPSEGISIEQFSASITGEKGWLPLNVKKAQIIGNQLLLNVFLTVSDPSTAKFSPDVHLNRNYPTEHPLLEILLIKQPENSQYAYASLENLSWHRVSLSVQAYQLSNLVVQNELGKLDVNSLMQPFSQRPTVGSKCYISCDEMARKPVDWLTLRYSWQDRPENFSSYYFAYNHPKPILQLRTPLAPQTLTSINPALAASAINLFAANNLAPRVGASAASTITTNSSNFDFGDDAFSTSVSVLNGGTWQGNFSAKLFTQTTVAEQQVTIQNPSGEPLFTFNQDLDEVEGFNKNHKQGFIRWQLTAPQQAFGHKIFAGIYAKRVAQLTSDDQTLLPNEPYVPVLASLYLNYGASLSLESKTSVATDNKAGIEFFQLAPFGSLLPSVNDSTPLLHKFETLVASQQQSTQGELYIGLSQVKPPQMVSLLFQVAEGSANPELNQETIHWSVLNKNQWQALSDKQLVSDSSNGLLRSGIVKLIIPEDITADSSLLPDGKIWLRAAVLKNTDAVNDLINVHTQAATASFVDHNNNPNVLSQALPAASISKLQIKQSQVKKVMQPYAAQKGKPQESPRAFRTRVSERLRHKDRAISMWDYEKLVLQAFPEIYKVKCINHSTYVYEQMPEHFLTSEFAPGYVTVVVIPDLTNQNAVNPLEPKTSLDKLSDIKRFLQARMNPFAAKRLRVVNPLYESVQLEFHVSFRDGIDPAIYKETLNNDLKAYLSPWAFFQQQGKDIHFGGKVYRSELVNFIEERPYVDYLFDVKMHQRAANSLSQADNEIGNRQRPDILAALPHSARSILVSHHQHDIQVGEDC